MSTLSISMKVTDVGVRLVAVAVACVPEAGGSIVRVGVVV